MNDSRVRRALALADDARTEVAELDDEGVGLPGSHYIAQARAALNRAITELNKLTPPEGDTAA